LAGQQPAAASGGRVTRHTGRVECMPQIGSPQLRKTLKRSALKRYRKPSVEMDDCVHRRDQCVGDLIVCRVNPDIVNHQPNAEERINGGLGACVVCKKTTPYFCLSCRLYFCNNGKERQLMLASSDYYSEDVETFKKKFIKVPYTHTLGNEKQQKRDEIVFKNLCAVIGHRKGLQLAARRQRTRRRR
jgi:hypothetical protein